MNERMVAYNAASAAGLKIVPADLGATDWADEKAIAAWQEAHQLRGDGWFGPRSALACRLAMCLAEAGLKVDRDKLRFSGLHSRIDPPIPWSVVWHDTVTRTAEDAHAVLSKRGLSTHFLLSEDGTIYQCADPGSMWALHAAAFNQESIGVDVVALLDPGLLDVKKHPDDAAREARLIARKWAGSKSGKVIDYTEAQKRAIPLLAGILSEVYQIPRHCQHGTMGYGEKQRTLNDRTFHGHVGHGQWSSKRWDGNLVVELLTAPRQRPW